MRGRYLTIVSALLFSLASQAGHAAQYITLDISFDEGTTLVGINSTNTGVGYSYDDRGQFHGFTFTPAGGYTGDIIVSHSTIPAGIDDAGDVAGYYFDARNGTTPAHGFFVSSNGTVTKFDAPGAGGGGASTGTFVTKMNAGGIVTGFFTGEDGVNHGYVRTTDGTLTVFDAPGAGGGASQGTLPEAISDKGAICGRVTDASGVLHAFIRKRHGAISTFDAPGAGTADRQGTVCVAIAGDGRTLGYMIDGSGALHGFLRARDGTFTALDIPGASQASASLFAGRRLIGGFYDSNGTLHSFIYGPGGAIKQIDDPNAGTGSSQGTTVSGIGGGGVMVGSYVDSNLVSHGFIRMP